MNDKTRENRLRRLACRKGVCLHKARTPFWECQIVVRYYLTNTNNNLLAFYSDLDAAEEDLLKEVPDADC